MTRPLEKTIIKNFHKSKRLKDIILSPLVIPLEYMKIPADIISIIGLLIGFAGLFYIRSSHTIFVWSLLIKRFADLLDGAVWRKTKTNPNIFRKINVDLACDLVYTILLLIVVGAITNTFLLVVSFVVTVVNIILNRERIGKTIFTPGSFIIQGLYLFKKFRTGLLLQIFYNLLGILYSRIFNENSLKIKS